MTEDLDVQLAEVVPLLVERAVAAAQNGIQNTVKVLASGDALQSLLQALVRVAEASRNLREVHRAARNVVRRVIRIDDRQPVGVLVREFSDMILIGLDVVSECASRQLRVENEPY